MEYVDKNEKEKEENENASFLFLFCFVFVITSKKPLNVFWVYQIGNLYREKGKITPGKNQEK